MNKAFRLLALLCAIGIWPYLGHAQVGTLFTGTPAALTRGGFPAAGAQVTVCSGNVTVGLCTPDSGESIAIKGVEGGSDIVAFGARAVPLGGPVGFPCSINSGSTTLTCTGIGGQGSFQNGDGIVILSAGPKSSLSTPSAPTVSTAAPASGIDTLTVVSGYSGGTGTATYYVQYDDGKGGTTALSAGTTVNNQAVLGVRTLTGCNVSLASGVSNVFFSITTISGCSGGTGNIAEIVGGEQIAITNTAADIFNGTVSVATASGTSFTVVTPFLAYGTVTSTGATITYYNGTSITSFAPSAVWEIHCYKSVGGKPTYIGSSLPYPAAFEAHMAADTCMDYGSTITPTDGSVVAPFWTSGSGGTNDFLSTTIRSGAPAGPFVLATAASSSVSSDVAYQDNSPALRACLAYPGNAGTDGVCIIPEIADSCFGCAFNFRTPVNVVGSNSAQPSYNGQTIVQKGLMNLYAPWQFEGSSAGSANWVGKDMQNWNNIVAGAFNSTAATICFVSPCAYTNYVSSMAMNISGIGISTRKNGVAFLLDCPQTFDINHSLFSNQSTTGGASLMGAPFIVRGPNCGNGTAYAKFTDNVLLSDSPGSNPTTAGDFVVLSESNSLTIDRLFMNGRGIVWNANYNQGFLGTFHNIYTQNQIYAPLITVAGLVTSCNAKLSDLGEDTSGQTLLAFVQGYNSGTAAGCPGVVEFSGSLVTGSGSRLTSGGPIGYLKYSGQGFNIIQNHDYENCAATGPPNQGVTCSRSATQGTIQSTASVATNFGTAFTSISIPVEYAGVYSILVDVEQTRAGVGCSGTSNEQVQLRYTNANGGTVSLTPSSIDVTFTGNGVVGNMGTTPVLPFTVNVQGATSVNISSGRNTVGAGCSATPQYQVYVKVLG